MKLLMHQTFFYSLLVVLLLPFMACNQDAIFYTIFQEVKPRAPRVKGTPSNMVEFTREYQVCNVCGHTFDPAINTAFCPGNTLHNNWDWTDVPVIYIASGRLNWYARPDSMGPPSNIIPDQVNWNHSKGSAWWNSFKGKMPQPGGTIIALAATDKHLYALFRNKQLKRIAVQRLKESNGHITHEVNKDPYYDTWETIPIDVDAADKAALENCAAYETLFSSNNRIFIGARLKENPGEKASPCAILYVSELPAAATIKILKNDADTHLLQGVAFDGTDHYLCTNNLYSAGGAIFTLPDTPFPPSASIEKIYNSDAEKNTTPLDKEKAASFAFMGIISLKDDPANARHTILAMDRRGVVFTINAAAKEFTETKIAMGTFTGGLGLWYDPADYDPNHPVNGLPKLLLAGYQGQIALSPNSGYTNGYMELELLWESGSLTLSETAAFHKPGEGTKTSTVENDDRYPSTIGKYPIRSFSQTPQSIDEHMTLFASTVNAGLWSYRNRKLEGKNQSVMQWNAEE